MRGRSLLPVGVKFSPLLISDWSVRLKLFRLVSCFCFWSWPYSGSNEGLHSWKPTCWGWWRIAVKYLSGSARLWTVPSGSFLCLKYIFSMIEIGFVLYFVCVFVLTLTMSLRCIQSAPILQTGLKPHEWQFKDQWFIFGSLTRLVPLFKDQSFAFGTYSSCSLSPNTSARILVCRQIGQQAMAAEKTFLGNTISCKWMWSHENKMNS